MADPVTDETLFGVGPEYTIREALNRHARTEDDVAWMRPLLDALDLLTAERDELKAEQDNAGFVPWRAAQDAIDDLEHRATVAETRVAELAAALREIEGSHDHPKLDRDPAQHCTNLVRIARAALSSETA